MYSFFVNINIGDTVHDILNVIIRTILILILIFILFKLMGPKQVSQMNMFDYITGITIGSVVADISLDIEKNISAGIACILIYSITSILISYLSLKNSKLRSLFNGREIPLITNGKINKKNMSKKRININILQTEARLKGYFNLDEINNAILEPSGMISFEPKEKEKTITKKDMGISSKNKGLVYNLIVDGKILKDNLEHAKKTEKWLKHELKVLGKEIENILLLTIDSEEKINLYTK